MGQIPSQDGVRRASSATPTNNAMQHPMPPAGPSSLSIRRKSSVSSAGGELPKSAVIPRKRFQVPTTVLPLCTKCQRGVEKQDQVKDGKELLFHRHCLECAKCHCQLARRERVQFRSHVQLTRDQFVEMPDHTYFCDKHSPEDDEWRRVSVKTQNIQEKYVKEEELVELGFARRETNLVAKRVLEESGGFAEELVCGRCGTSINKEHKIVMGGMSKFHELCPSKHEVELSNKSIKYFMKRLPERLAVSLHWGEENGESHTFLYLLDRDAWRQAYNRGGNLGHVYYFPDPDAVDVRVKRFASTSSDNAVLLSKFDVQVKHYPAAFGYASTKQRSADSKNGGGPQIDLVKHTLRMEKHSFANGVHQTLLACFAYNPDDAWDPIQSDQIVLSFEKDVYDVDPLAQLKLSKKLASVSIIHGGGEREKTEIVGKEEVKEEVKEEAKEEETAPLREKPHVAVASAVTAIPKRRLTGISEASTLQARRALFERKA
ncbi:hypothetical protein BASA81_006406 [Batrachochytrium salamandrivorans]|nr:hypothetical protein BASA81_006406 [Batrachochytrium salamandrivorans]